MQEIYCRLIDDEQPQSPPRATFGWNKYYDLDAIYKWLDNMLEQYPKELTNYNIGKSYENRTIRAVKLSRKEVRKLKHTWNHWNGLKNPFPCSLEQPNDLHWIHNTCPWVDYSCNSHLYFERINNIRWSKNKRIGRKFWFCGHSCFQCWRLCLFALQGKKNMLINMCNNSLSH